MSQLVNVFFPNCVALAVSRKRPRLFRRDLTIKIVGVGQEKTCGNLGRDGGDEQSARENSLEGADLNK